MSNNQQYLEGYKKGVQDVIQLIKKQASELFFDGKDDIAVYYRDLSLALKELLEEEKN